MSTFKNLGLNSLLLKAVSDLGYEQPTPIQKKAIPQLLTSENDLKAFAQTGTGKTAAFSLPVLEQLDTNLAEVQAVILSPTRELALQIGENIEQFSKYMSGCKTVTVYGGANIDKQIKAINKGAQIIVGTPGRTVDLLKRRKLSLGHVKWAVLDEADEMLNMGFKDDLDFILSKTPVKKQTLLFSATFPKEVDKIAKKYLKNAIEITAGEKNVGAKNVSHHYYLIAERNRYAALKRIADIHPDIYGIIFCRTRREAKNVAAKLIDDGYNVDALHGDLSQAQRDIAMEKFRSKYLQLLVATDVAARGLDVDDLTHVINYKIPDQIESYTHRSGRTGRAGKEGVSVVLINQKEKRKIKEIEKIIAKKFTQREVPKGREICEKQLFSLIDKVKNVTVKDDEIDSFLNAIYSRLSSLDREELIKRFVSVEFNRFLAYYQDADDINAIDNFIPKTAENFTRFYINLGKMDKINPAKLMGIINENLSKNNVEIGQIEIFKSFSFFEIDKAFTDEVLEAFRNVRYQGRAIVVEVTTKPKSRKGRRRKNKFIDKNQNNFRKKKRRKKR
ncbi:MAG: DEAD/DEAH box helicase [Flavobacteriales bacterium]|nr:MAG: DEAD/DEAH box helicase [Flavobacteriales bacterium]